MFIRFNPAYKYSELHQDFDLTGKLIAMPLHNEAVTDQSIAYHAQLSVALNGMIKKIVGDIKKGIGKFYTGQFTLSVEWPTSPLLTTPYLTALAQALYRSFGIEIQLVDALTMPRKGILSWQKDHPGFSSLPAQIINHKDELSKCMLTFKGGVYFVPTILLMGKSRYFEQTLTTQLSTSQPITLEIIIEDVEKDSFKIVVNYFNDEELDLKKATLVQIDQVIKLARLYSLLHLEQLCFECLAQTITPDNLESYAALADKYEEPDLKKALLEKISFPIVHSNKTQSNYESELAAIEGQITLSDANTFNPKWYYLEKDQIAQLFRNFIEPNPPAIIERTQPIRHLLHLAHEQQSSEMLEALVASMKKICSHPHYNTHLGVLLDGLIISHHVWPHLTWLGTKPNPMHDFTTQLVQHIATHITPSNARLMWQIACDHDILELKQRCLKLVFIPEVKKICNTRYTTAWGQGWLGDFKTLFQIILQSQSVELTQEAINHLKTYEFDNYLPNIVDELGDLDFCLQFAYSKDEPKNWPANFQELFPLFKAKVLKMTQNALKYGNKETILKYQGSPLWHNYIANAKPSLQ